LFALSLWERAIRMEGEGKARADINLLL